MDGIIAKVGNLQGLVPPSEATGHAFRLQMILDALDYHENGDETDPACCTGDAPCQTRIFLVGQQRSLAGKMIGEREVRLETVKAEIQEAVRSGSGQTSTGQVADPASPAQIQYIRGLDQQHDCSKIGTFPRRTLDAILSDQEVSKGRASRLIEVMLRQPKQVVAPIDPTPAAGPAPTDPQMGLLRTLAEENGEDVPAIRTKAEASQEIGRLIQAREDRKRAGSARVRTGSKITEDGMYRTSDGTVYKVQIAKNGSGRLYAKKLVEHTDEDGTTQWSFEYAEGAASRLTPADRMTLEQAQEFGKLYGVCCRCATDLTDEASIERGMGPVCAGRM